MTEIARSIEPVFHLTYASAPAYEKNICGNSFNAVYNCDTLNPSIISVQDPFGSLLAKAKGSVLITTKEKLFAAQGEIQ